MSTIFISYSSADRLAAEQMLAQLQQWQYVDPFLSSDGKSGILVGSDWMAELYSALRKCKALIFLCSDHSMRSAWCLAEVVQAHASGKFIAPIVIAPYDQTSALAPLVELVRDRQAADLTAQPDAYERLRRALEVNGIDARDELPFDRHRDPYPGMLAFDEADGAIYFGRDREIDEFLDTVGRMRVRDTRMIVVLGESGSGKSSFVRAGILPRLRKNHENWLIVPPVRPKAAPFDELARALSDACTENGRTLGWEEIKARLDGDIAAAAAALIALATDLASVPIRHDGPALADSATKPALRTVLIVLDQLEELLAPGREADAERFLRLLCAALGQSGTPLLVVATLRVDFWATLQRQRAIESYPPLQFTLPNMPPARAADVIRGPAELAGITIQEGLVERMMAEMEGDDALPLLAFTLHELCVRCHDSRELTLAAYEEIGGIRGAVEKSLREEVNVDRLKPEEQNALRTAFLDRLSKLSNDGARLTRQPARWEDIPDLARPILDMLVKARLLIRSVDADKQGIIEVAHESLFRTWRTLAGWVKEDQEFLLWRDRMRDRLLPGELLTGRELSKAQHYRKQYKGRFEDADLKFIQRSAVAKWKNRAMYASPAIVLAMLLVVGAYYGNRWRAERAVAQRAGEKLASDPYEGVRLAAAAVEDSQQDYLWSRVGWDEDLWSMLRQALRQSHVRAVLPGVAGEAMNFAVFGRDAHTVVTANTDGTARVWELDWGKLDPTRPSSPDTRPLIFTHQQQVLRAMLSPDQSRLLSIDGERASVWDIATKKLVAPPLAHGALVTAAAFGCDGRLVFTGDSSGNARLWTPDDGKVVSLQPHGDKINSASFDRDCQRLLTASDDGTARIWLPSGAVVAELRHDKKPVNSARFSADGRKVVTASGDAARIWEAESGRQDTPAFKCKAELMDARLSPDGRHLVAVGVSGVAHWWDVANPDQQNDLGEHTGLVSELDFSPHGEWFVTAGEDGLAQLWSTANGSHLAYLRGHTGPIKSARFSPDGHYIVTAGADGTARVWTVGADAEALAVLRSDAQPYGALFAPDGETVVTFGNDGGQGFAMVSLAGAEEPLARLPVRDGTGAIHQAAFSHGGAFLITAADKSGAQVWQPAAGLWSEVSDPIDWPATITSAAITANGQIAATASTVKPAALWTREAGAREWREGAALVPKAQAAAVEQATAQSVAFSPDDQMLAAAIGTGVFLWSVPSGQEVGALEGHTHAVTSTQFSPDGTLIATASEDNTARIWELSSRRVLQTLKHDAPVTGATFTPDGKALVTISGTDAYFWNVATGRRIRSPQKILDNGMVWSATVQPSGQLLAVAAGDKTVRFYQWEDFAPRDALLREVARRDIAVLDAKAHGDEVDVTGSPLLNRLTALVERLR